MKLPQSQARFILKSLKRVASATLSQLEPQIREALVPPKVTPSELKKFLIKLAYDKPKELVDHILRGDPWELETKRHEERDAGFAEFHQAMSDIREAIGGLLLQVEADLLFKDDWGEGYPEYLETELVDSIQDLLNGEDDDA